MTAPPVYLLTIDSLRVDSFTPELFSRCWDTFRTDFTRFSTAYANGIATPLSFPSILADEHVTGNGVLSPASTTLAELIPGHSVALPNNPHVSPERGYDRDFDQFDREHDVWRHLARLFAVGCYKNRVVHTLRRRVPFVPDPVVPIPYIPGEEIVYELKRTITLRDPAFLWGHFMDPHGPYYPQLVFDRHLEVPFTNSGLVSLNQRWSDNAEIDPDSLDVMRMLYREKVRYLDRQLANFFDWLEDSGAYDDAFIIVTADHGQFLGENGRFGHDWDFTPVDELLRVPLLVKFPGSDYSGEEFSHSVQHLDIHSTVAERLDLDADVNPDSRSFVTPGTRPIISKSNTAIRAISDGGEAIVYADGRVEITGSPDPTLIERAKTEPIPRVTPDVGQDAMSQEERVEVNKRLADLGYR